MNEDADMLGYYRRRAPEYEDIYARPERQADLRALERLIAETCAGRDVLDVACGTGWFTRVAATVARRVTGVDANQRTLALARVKQGLEDARLLAGDAYALPEACTGHDAAIATFWWSHVPLARLDTFLDALHARLVQGARVLFSDNRYVEGSSTPIARTDREGNTYQRRRLADGSEHEVLKNFPAPQALRNRGARAGREVEVVLLDHFWVLRYVLG